MVAGLLTIVEFCMSANSPMVCCLWPVLKAICVHFIVGYKHRITFRALIHVPLRTSFAYSVWEDESTIERRLEKSTTF